MEGELLKKKNFSKEVLLTLFTVISIISGYVSISESIKINVMDVGLPFFKTVNSNLYLVEFFFFYYYATDLLSGVDSQIPGL